MAVNLDMIRTMAEMLKIDPKTGKCDVQGLLGYIAEKLEDDALTTALQHFSQIKLDDFEDGPRRSDCSKVVFSALPVQPGALWIVKLHFNGMVDDLWRPVSSRRAKIEKGLKQSFRLFCWILLGPDMAEDRPRNMEQYIGPPTTAEVGQFIRRSMAIPFNKLDPCLPSELVISSALDQHIPAIRPFLDSLPAPFFWHVAPAEIEAVESGVRYRERKRLFRECADLAKERKELGNKAFAAKDLDGANTHYLEALGYLEKSMLRLNHGEDESMINEAARLQAICFSNISYANLLMGRKECILVAYTRAEMAIACDELFPKGYIRLSRVYETQGELAEAEEAIIRALRLPELEDNKALVDHLISLQTGGKGLPTDAETFTKWLKETFSEGEPRALRMKGVGGLWLKICNAHVEKMSPPALKPNNKTC